MPLRVLFAPETFNLGETSRGIEVARAMRRAGHEVLFMGYSRRFADRVREAGFELELLDPELSEAEADQLIAADQGRSLRHPFTTAMVRRRVRSELDLYARWRPDVIVIGTTFTTFVSARAAAVPLVYVKPHAMSGGHLSTMRRLPLLSGHGPMARTVNRAAAAAVRAVLPAIRWRPAAFRLAAREHGVQLPSRTLDVLEGDLNLIASLFPALDGRELAPGERAVGPIYARDEAELPAEVAAFADRSRPTVYVGLGSSANRELAVDVLTRVGALDVDVISTAGRYLSARDRAGLASNVQVHDYLPAHRLGGLIDASVIHGGEGTVQTACASGAPFAAIGLQLEQRVNIDECVRFGNALSFSPRDLRAGRLPGIVEHLLTGEVLRRRAHDLAARMDGLDGAAVSAEAIAEHVGGTQRCGTDGIETQQAT